MKHCIDWTRRNINEENLTQCGKGYITWAYFEKSEFEVILKMLSGYDNMPRKIQNDIELFCIDYCYDNIKLKDLTKETDVFNTIYSFGYLKCSINDREFSDEKDRSKIQYHIFERIRHSLLHFKAAKNFYFKTNHDIDCNSYRQDVNVNITGTRIKINDIELNVFELERILDEARC